MLHAVLIVELIVSQNKTSDSKPLHELCFQTQWLESSEYLYRVLYFRTYCSMYIIKIEVDGRWLMLTAPWFSSSKQRAASKSIRTLR